ncbi:MAG: hypothetical protein ING65_10835 [Rhodocyclaceae bacterium]|nr:hypothetical protein [Rhodocyclaceae bacterium]
MAAIRTECAAGLTPQSRTLLGAASRSKGQKGWFKSVGVMELAARELIAPELPQAVVLPV